MRYMTATEIRMTWLEFFKEKKHKIEQSSSLIPQDDPTLLWINSGVAPMKKYFEGTQIPSNPRIANIQKCIRTNDIDNVGKTARHHTLFEMLGNFSIGNYFKGEALAWGLELLTDPKWFGFDVEKLYITYYPDDLKAKQIWLALGIKEDHLIPRVDNFWEIGPGPCGPDTEIYYDRGLKYDIRGIGLVEDDIENDRYIEIWNIVFSQFNSKPELKRKDYPELPSKNIDTGAGLERFACVLQETETNFETDLFYPIILHLEKIAKIKYNGQMAFKVIADHIKALVVAISDGAALSNEGRGYVLRRLLRRAVKYGRSLKITKPFLHLLVDDVVEIMGGFYSNLKITRDIVIRIITKEEEKFLETISEGEKHLIQAIDKNNNSISGKTAFKLYDTYGFPIELTLEYASEHGVLVDEKGFHIELEKQKQRSRSARTVQTGMKDQEDAYLNFTDESRFVGYNELETKAKVIKVFDRGIVLDKTPFYATSGGQIADKGTINGAVVNDVIKLPNKQALHVLDEKFYEQEGVIAIVDEKYRLNIIRNHTATHLFHQALKELIGKHANQQGSQVSAKNLRFDFNHYDTMQPQDILKIENLVKHYVKKENLEVIIKEMNLKEAKEMGAMALFGEKYEDVVRVVDLGWSIELCGGTHVKNTKEIIDFAITTYESIGSGTYRIEAVTGNNIEQQVENTLEPLYQEVSTLSEKMKKMSKEHDIPTLPVVQGSYQDIVDLRKYLIDFKELIKNIEKKDARQKQQGVLNNLDNFAYDLELKKQVIVTHNIEAKTLKQLVDALYDKIKADVLFIANVQKDKVTFICKSELGNAGSLVKQAAKITNGSGGGRPNFAQGGSQDLTNLDDALEHVKKSL